ncbi:MAG: L,D-transpeptidase [Polyangiaceae bacterium]|nr:L,D-transpeptidase [Polyangiaceae bacterium]
MRSARLLLLGSWVAPLVACAGTPNPAEQERSAAGGAHAEGASAMAAPRMDSGADAEGEALGTGGCGTMGTTVSLGEAKPSEPPRPELPRDGPRVYAKSRFVWVRPQPNPNGWVGFLWLGGSAKLREAEPAIGPGCPGPENNSLWYAIEPFGYVCVDGNTATLDADDPALQATLPHAPRTDTPWPHQYGESRGIQKYKAPPTRAERRRREWDLPEHEAALARARGEATDEGASTKQREHDERLQGVDLSLPTAAPMDLGAYPSTLNEPRNRLLPLSTVAYSAEATFEGTPLLLTADLMWVPKTRVVPYPKIDFRGIRVGEDLRLTGGALPRVAFFRKEDRPHYRPASDGFEPVPGQVFARLSWVELTGQQREVSGASYLEVQGGAWLKRTDAVLPEIRTETPWGAVVGQPDETGLAPKGRATWVETNVWQGWLVAYEGTQVVYITLISPGRGGTPTPGVPAIDTAATPTGSFKITGKFATATMEAPGEFIHSDVPWAQNFSGPHALHGAYWHDRWGERMSAGCVNLSPIDGKWLFDFTEPALPEGWHGVRWRPSEEPATQLIVR